MMTTDSSDSTFKEEDLREEPTEVSGSSGEDHSRRFPSLGAFVSSRGDPEEKRDLEGKRPDQDERVEQDRMAGIPLSYIVHRLHGLADHFWTRPESADCTVIVPLPIAPVPSSANGFGTRRGSARFAGAGDRNPRHADVARFTGQGGYKGGPGSDPFDRRLALNTLAGRVDAQSASTSSAPPSQTAWDGRYRISAMSARRRESENSSMTCNSLDSMSDSPVASTTASTPSTSAFGEELAGRTDPTFHRTSVSADGEGPEGSMGGGNGPTYWHKILNPLQQDPEASIRRGSEPVVRAPYLEGRRDDERTQHSSESGGGHPTAEGREAEEKPSGRLEDHGILQSRLGLVQSLQSTSMRRLTFRLHKDYLSTQSTLFRQFLSSATPLDLDTGCTTPPDGQRSRTPPEASARDQVVNLSERVKSAAEDRRGSFLPLLNPFGQPRLLSSNPDNPTLFLPLPDPSSFTILLHYLYHGDFEVVARSMSQKKVRWEGVVMNADFLGLDEVLKNELGVWWRRNISPLAPPPPPPPPPPHHSHSPIQSTRFRSGSGIWQSVGDGCGNKVCLLTPPPVARQARSGSRAPSFSPGPVSRLGLQEPLSPTGEGKRRIEEEDDHRAAAAEDGEGSQPVRATSGLNSRRRASHIPTSHQSGRADHSWWTSSRSTNPPPLHSDEGEDDNDSPQTRIKRRNRRFSSFSSSSPSLANLRRPSLLLPSLIDRTLSPAASSHVEQNFDPVKAIGSMTLEHG